MPPTTKLEIFPSSSRFGVPASLKAALSSVAFRSAVANCSVLERPEVLRNALLVELANSDDWTDEAETVRDVVLTVNDRVTRAFSERIMADCRFGDCWLTVAPGNEAALCVDLARQTLGEEESSIHLLPTARSLPLFPTEVCSFEAGQSALETWGCPGAMLVGIEFDLVPPSRPTCTGGGYVVIRTNEGTAWLESASDGLTVEIVDLDWGDDVDVHELGKQLAATPQVPWGSIGYRQAAILEALTEPRSRTPVDVVVLVRRGIPSLVGAPDGVHVEIRQY